MPEAKPIQRLFAPQPPRDGRSNSGPRKSYMEGQLFWMPWRGEWISWRGDGSELVEKYGKVEAKDILFHYREYEKNRLARFLPHSGGKDFLNDWSNGIVLLTSPTRCGKSTCGTAFALFRAIPCHPEWPCFTEHGLEYHEWRGPRKLLITSYSWDNVAEVWKEYQKWCPREELGPYALDWGRYGSDQGRAKEVMLGDGKPKCVRLKCGTELVFGCDGQQQHHFEGKRYDDGHFDEQREEEKFIGYLRGTSNTQGLVQACFTLTGHVLEGRPDTGASGWIKRKLFDGTYTFGKKVGRYKISMEDVPEAVLSKERKAELKKQWVTDPEKTGDQRTLRKAQARYWGGWESGSGLVLDNFDDLVHVIPPIDLKHEVFRKSTKYRSLDHGTQRPTACLWAVVFPWGDVLGYREYYVAGEVVPKHALAIVKASGNMRRVVDTVTDEEQGSTYSVWMEDQVNERYFSSVLDSRDAGKRAHERQCTLGQLYNDYGVNCTPAKGLKNRDIIPRMRAMLEIDPARKHIMAYLFEHGMISKESFDAWLEPRNGNMFGGARFYITSDMPHFLAEVRAWALKPDTDEPQAEDDHLAGACFKYLVMEEPRYMGDVEYEGAEEAPKEPADESNAVCGSTGY